MRGDVKYHLGHILSKNGVMRELPAPGPASTAAIAFTEDPAACSATSLDSVTAPCIATQYYMSVSMRSSSKNVVLLPVSMHCCTIISLRKEGHP